MATETSTLPAATADEIAARTGTIRKMLMVGAALVVVGLVLIYSALVLELTQFHPLLDSFFATFTQHSVAGGGPDRAGLAGINGQLAEINKFPSLLLWLKLGGIGHILAGVFVALAAIIRALAMMPDRLGTMLLESASPAEETPADD